MIRPFVFWGTESRFSLEVAREMLENGFVPQAVFVPASDEEQKAAICAQPAPVGASFLPLAAQTLPDLAYRQGVPVWRVREVDHADTLAQLLAYSPEVACVACYPDRFPRTLLDALTHGFLNVHPSLLPAYRGPAPLFWQFHAGLTQVGVTIHQMDEGFDTGDIISQAPIRLPLGISGPDADVRCGRLGGALLAEIIPALCDGQLQAVQQPGGGHRQGWPSEEDFELSMGWPASRAYHFMRGTAEWKVPYWVQVGGRRIRLRTALSWHYGVSESRITDDQDVVEVQFSPGVLVASVAR